MADNRRVVVTVTDEMLLALKRHASSRGASMSGLIRVILGEWLESQGSPVEWVIEWGGRRVDESDADISLSQE